LKSVSDFGLRFVLPKSHAKWLQCLFPRFASSIRVYPCSSVVDPLRIWFWLRQVGISGFGFPPGAGPMVPRLFSGHSRMERGMLSLFKCQLEQQPWAAIKNGHLPR
jgi:hypothetical protein